jgi:hypothetical protein
LETSYDTRSYGRDIWVYIPFEEYAAKKLMGKVKD